MKHSVLVFAVVSLVASVFGETAPDLTEALVNHGIPLSSKYSTQYYARNPWDLKAFEGRLYIGSGNSANEGPETNSGPVDIMCYDPETGTYTNELTILEEQIDAFRILDNGGLYIPGHDPRGGGGLFIRAKNASGPNVWQEFKSNFTGIEHCYDVTMFDGKLIASGNEIWMSPDTSAANLAKFSSYSISGRRYSMLVFPNALYAIGTATIGGKVGQLTYGDTFGIDRLPKGGSFAAVNNAGTDMSPKANRDYVFPDLGTTAVKDGFSAKHPISIGERVVYIGGLLHNDHQMLPVAAYSSTDGEAYFTATKIALPEGAVPWDTMLYNGKAYLLWTTKSGDKFANHVSESSDGLVFTEKFYFTADSFARSFEYLGGKFYFGLGAENVDIFDPHSAAKSSLLSAVSGTILSCPYDLNLPEDDIEYPQEDDPDIPPASGATAKAVYDATAKTLTFYYDELTHEGEGTVYAISTDGTCSWSEVLSTLTKATFDPSFSYFRPTSCASWFGQASNNTTLTAIEGLQYLNTSEVTSMASMFARNSKLAAIDVSHFNTARVTNMSSMFYYVGCKTLDLSSFDTDKVTNMSSMFGYSSALTTVYASEKFTTAGVTSSSKMFTGAKNIVGGAETKYSDSAVDKTYARIDGGTSNPGYFTLKGADPVVEHKHVWGPWVTNKVATATEAGERYRECTAEGCTNPVARETETIPATGGGEDPDNPPASDATAKAVYDDATKTLTFYYDTLSHEGEGTTNYVVTASSVEWVKGNAFYQISGLAAERVVFDSSFKDFRPTSMKFWFAKFTKLVSITGLEYLNTSEVTSMAGLFGYCHDSFHSVDLSHFNTANVTDMNNMFYYSGLTTLDLTSFDTAKVTNMSSMFDQCSVKTIFVTNTFVTTAVTSSSKMFNKTGNLVGGKETKYSADHIDMEYARIDNPPDAPGYFSQKGDDPDDPPVVEHTHDWGPWITNKVATATEAGQRYRDCVAEGCTVPPERQYETIPATGGGEDPVDPPVSGATAKAVFDDVEKTLTFYYDELTHEGEGTVFAMTPSTAPWTSSDDVKTATKVVFDPSFKDFRPMSMASWFASFKVLAEFEGMENLVTSEVTSMGSLFAYCAKLNTVDLSHFDTSNVKNMSRMFYNSGVKIYDLLGFDTGKVTDMSQMFAYTGGNKLNLSSFATTNVTTMSKMFLHARFNAIAVSELWSTENVPAGQTVFGSNLVGTSALTGGAGTLWVDGNDGVEYACVDNPPDHPGYFTYAKPGEKPQTLPVIESVTISSVATNGVTVNVSGKDLDSGFFKVEIYDNDWLLVLTTQTVNGWGSVKVTGLNPASSYYARAIATNGESGMSATYEDVPFVTDVQKGIAWVTLKDVSVTVADDGASANITATIDTCNIDGALSFKLNGVEAKGWTLSAASEGETFSATVPLTPYAKYTWIFEASGEYAGVKAIDTASGSFVASVRELWVNVAFAGGAYDVSSSTVPEATESPKGVWTPGTGNIAYAASAATGVGNDVTVEGSLEAFAVDESAAVPSGVKAVFGFVAYDGALKPAVWAKGAWHPFGFRCFTPGDTVAYTLNFDFQAEIPCVKATVGTETSDWFEIDAAAKSLTGFVFDGSADLGDFRGWQYLTGAGGEIILRPPTISSASGSLILADGKFSVELTDCVKDAWYTPFYSDTLENPDWTAGNGVQCKTEGESLALEVLADSAEKPSMFVKIVVSVGPIDPGTKLN